MIIIILYAAPSNIVVNISEFFGTNGVTATLEWTQENDVNYDVNIFPQVSSTVKVLRSSSLQLTLLYNTHYNVSIVAIRCEETTTFIPIYYGEILILKIITLNFFILVHVHTYIHNIDSINCGNPLNLVNGQNLARNDSMISVLGFSHPAMEGASVNFVCSPNHVLFGPHSATCMGNGEWKPDPREVECKGD